MSIPRSLSNRLSGGNIGVAITYGSSGLAAGITVGAHAGKGNADGTSLTHTHSHVGSLTGDTTITAGDTTAIKGAQVLGQSVTLNTTNLNIQSLQDTATYNSKQKNASEQATISLTGAGSSASASLSKTNIDSDYTSVNEQSGIIAGDGGYKVSVANDTSLTGGYYGGSSPSANRGSFVNGFENFTGIDIVPKQLKP